MFKIFSFTILFFSLYFYEQGKIIDNITTPKNLMLQGVAVFGEKQCIKSTAEKTSIDINNNPLLTSDSSIRTGKQIPDVITKPMCGFSLKEKGVVINWSL